MNELLKTIEYREITAETLGDYRNLVLPMIYEELPEVCAASAEIHFYRYEKENRRGK